MGRSAGPEWPSIALMADWGSAESVYYQISHDCTRDEDGLPNWIMHLCYKTFSCCQRPKPACAAGHQVHSYQAQSLWRGSMDTLQPKRPALSAHWLKAPGERALPCQQGTAAHCEPLFVMCVCSIEGSPSVFLGRTHCVECGIDWMSLV